MRTIQETDGPETICVVFSSGAASWEANSAKPDDRIEKEKLSKCKMYVEAVEHEASNGRVGCNFYLVLDFCTFAFSNFLKVFVCGRNFEEPSVPSPIGYPFN